MLGSKPPRPQRMAKSSKPQIVIHKIDYDDLKNIYRLELFVNGRSIEEFEGYLFEITKKTEEILREHPGAWIRRIS